MTTDRKQLAREMYDAFAAGDRATVTYEATKADGHRLRNTEVLTFTGNHLRRAEVYFGWDVG